jgi:ribonuclease HII
VKIQTLVGVDEVGRGPVAGPVYVCALSVKKKDIQHVIDEGPSPLRDSKKLNSQKRKAWFLYLQELRKQKVVSWSVLSLSAADVDEYGIAVCIKRLVDKSVERLKVERSNTHVYLDGGLELHDTSIKSTAVIKGDEEIPVIALASIVAKVLRDVEMVKHAVEYPQYGLDANKGYGTKDHMKAIKRLGLTNLHRKTFLRKYL